MTVSSYGTAESARDLDRLIARSQRHSGARLPSTFARSQGDGVVPPLADLIHGGRGGEVRLKLYVSIVLLAGSMKAHPQFGRNTIVDVSGPTWARILALPSTSCCPATTGTTIAAISGISTTTP